MSEAVAYTLLDLFKVLVAAYRHIAFGAVAGLGGALAYGFLATPMYRAEVVAAPVAASNSSPLSKLTGQLGGLAALAGVSVGSGANRDEALAVLESAKFGHDTIVRENLMQVLFEHEWDAARGQWKGQDARAWPTLQDAWKIFDLQVRTVVEDRDRGLVTLRVELPDARLAAKLANGMIARLNEDTRSRRLAELDQSIKFLERELANTSVVETREAIASVLEAQVNERMLASVQADFALRVIDPAIVADQDKYVSPKRLLWSVLGIVGGGGLGFLVFLLLTTFRRPESR